MHKPDTAIRVALVDDDPLARQLLVELLSRDASIEVVMAAVDGADCLRKVDELGGSHGIDVLLADVSMPGLSGIEVVRHLRQRHPEIASVMLTTFQSNDWLRDALNAGAMGFITKDAPGREIIDALQRAFRGERQFSSTPAEMIVKAYTRDTLQQPNTKTIEFRERFSKLSKNQKAIAQLVSQAKTNNEIGADLFLSANTVRRIVSELLESLDCTTRTMLATQMVRSGLAEDD